MTQVLVNLLSNAIRFTAKSDTRIVTLAVEVSAKAPDRDAPLIPPEETEYYIEEQKPVYLFFSVEDTGPGMTKEESGRLFAKFMQSVFPLPHRPWLLTRLSKSADLGAFHSELRLSRTQLGVDRDSAFGSRAVRRLLLRVPAQLILY